MNPYSGKQIFLVPKQYLRPMPTLNPDSYWGYCYDQSAEQMRNEFGEEITRNVNKERIMELALKRFDSVEDYIEFLEKTGGAPYDLDKDPKGLIKWYYASREFVQTNPIPLSFSTADEFSKFVDELIRIFKNYVENQGGWELIYNDDGSPKSERACQRLFLGIVLHYCRANDIDLSQEVNIGRGPVDFKVSKGMTYRALIEMKLAKNTKFWNGLEKQLPKYLEAEEIKEGRFLVISFDENDVKKLNGIYEKIADIRKKTDYAITHEVVQAIYKPPSASKL